MMIDIEIWGGPRFSVTEEQARWLARALGRVVGEPKPCSIRGTCSLYPKSQEFMDEGHGVSVSRKDEEDD